jgi:hypothetical protein
MIKDAIVSLIADCAGPALKRCRLRAKFQIETVRGESKTQRRFAATVFILARNGVRLRSGMLYRTGIIEANGLYHSRLGLASCRGFRSRKGVSGQVHGGPTIHSAVYANFRVG